MHPLLFQLGPLKIYSYGVMIACAFLAGISLASRQAKRVGVDPQKILDLCFYILLSAIVGSRLLFVITNYRDFISSPLRIFKLWEGGLVFYGGLILGVIVVFVYMKKNNMPMWKTTDILAPSLALGQCIGRWGCFFAGCCYGKPTTVPWAITFTNKYSLAPLGIPLHPTQIYSSMVGATIFTILIVLRRKKMFDGELFWIYGILYSVGRSVIEVFRGDERGFVFNEMISTSQFISIFLFAISVFMFFRVRRHVTI